MSWYQKKHSFTQLYLCLGHNHKVYHKVYFIVIV